MKTSIKSLTKPAMSRLLGRSGATITADVINADVAKGAPENADGTMNLIHYMAWLIKELANRKS